LAEERTKFLFEGNNEMPEGYVPPKSWSLDFDETTGKAGSVR